MWFIKLGLRTYFILKPDRYFEEENVAKKITFISTDVAICFIRKIFFPVIYTLVGRIIVCLFQLIRLFPLD